MRQRLLCESIDDARIHIFVFKIEPSDFFTNTAIGTPHARWREDTPNLVFVQSSP